MSGNAKTQLHCVHEAVAATWNYIPQMNTNVDEKQAMNSQKQHKGCIKASNTHNHDKSAKVKEEGTTK